MTKVTFSKDELVYQMKLQLSSIEQFCKIYDEDKYYISQDIAVKIRVIFHQTDQSKSLINLLKLNHLPIICTSNKYDSKSLMKSHLGLVSMEHRVDMGWRYSPTLSLMNSKMVNQNNWWNNQKVIVDSNGISYSRSKIIKDIANKDGGAHVDDSIWKDIYDLTRSTTSGWAMQNHDGTAIPMNPVPPSIRQMAYELLETFRNINIGYESKLR
ncbi:hypothetical protein HDF18_03785 [Mucilaginibacter sp. X5P1]|uniref:hypothetical protein n=1 Tax=Mucilaginibacter sp. X5P1 TaxID=2723088 RepID=UPI001619C8DD|nr:hypothetical protein [Mucilaginibacter sp. X5P1]MBB6136736.1 hypothetical protein [Mucilaginibacter sp. X5P1]